MIENKIEKWINDSNENKAYPILILKVKDEKIENVQRKEHDGKIKESVVFHSKPWGWFMLCLNE